ncbi:probable calcium-binding protein CML27 [Cannabis sativa]|uniref:probable calcium-binding protein CML27 n=1 Tax=Cannabis sativa TaxID=3483 RepID=UPI0029CA6627|nr:probable calcium-binding protein CML27 [Cannabis sativa]
MAATTTNKPIQSKSSSFVYLQNPDELQKVFSQFDTNGDGKISVSELGDVLKALGTTVASKDLTQLMEDLDSDHDKSSQSVLHQQPIVINDSSWQAPIRSWIKFNCDVTVGRDSMMLAVVAKNSDSDVVWVETKSHVF